MTPIDLIRKVEDLGIVLAVAGDSISFKGPKGALPPSLRELLVADKPAVLAALRDRASRSPACTVTAQTTVEGASVDQARIRPSSRPEASADAAYGPEKLRLLVEAIGHRMRCWRLSANGKRSLVDLSCTEPGWKG
jgi:TubC N-terminal docking domain